MGVADEEAINSNDSMMVESISESARESKGKELKRKTSRREGGEIEVEDTCTFNEIPVTSLMP